MAKKKQSSGKAFSIKEFFVLHVEKFVFAAIAMLSGSLMALGFSAPITLQQNPSALNEQATQASRQLKETHWDAIKEAQKPVEADFVAKVGKTRSPIAANSISIFPKGDKSSNKRGDPKLAAPFKLKGAFFSGPMAFGLAPRELDKVLALDDAKKPDDKKKKNNAGGPGMGAGGEGGFGGEGGDGMGMGPGGPGGMGPGMGGSTLLGPRYMTFAYDRGFQLGMKTFADFGMGGPGSGDGMGGPGGGMGQCEWTGGEGAVGMGPGGMGPGGSGGSNGPGMTGGVPDPKKTKSQAISFVAVTALAPHADYEALYKAEFAESPGYIPGRDTPNYIGFEVQRVEITASNAHRAIEENEWVPLPNVSTIYKESIKKQVGSCAEVIRQTWVSPHISCRSHLFSFRLSEACFPSRCTKNDPRTKRA